MPIKNTTPSALAVPFPEAGDGATLSLSIADLRALGAEMGKEYIRDILRALDAADVEIIEKVLALATKDGDYATALEAAPLEEISAKIADALMLRLRGKTMSEIADVERA